MRSFLLCYFLNAVWQLPLLFLVARLLSPMLRRLSAKSACWYWRAVLVLSVAVPATSLQPSVWWNQLRLWFAPAAQAAGGSVTVSSSVQPLQGGMQLSPLCMGLLLALPLTTATLFALRLALGFVELRRLKLSLRSFALPASLDARFGECVQHFGLQKPCLAEADGLATVLTFGFQRSTIVFPPDVAGRAAPDDLLAALAHECAHIQRHDTLWSLLLQIVTLPIAFHPVTQLALRQHAAAREIDCDEQAAGFLQGRQRYAHALLRLAAVLASAPPASSLHAIGLFDAHSLERRLMHLQRKLPCLGRASALARIALVTFSLAGAWVTASALRFPVMEQAAPASAPPLQVESGVMAGQVQSQVPPIYPPDAKAAKIEGTVVLKAIIDAEGKVQNLQVVSGPDQLQGSAIDAVRQWTYKPYEQNGQAVPVETTIHINYKLQ